MELRLPPSEVGDGVGSYGQGPGEGHAGASKPSAPTGRTLGRAWVWWGLTQPLKAPSTLQEGDAGRCRQYGAGGPGAP